jgi:hypothetical protein
MVILIISGLIPAVLTGSIFRELTFHESRGSEASLVYSSDLAGSAMGFIIFSGIAVPLIGIKTSLFLLPVIVLVGFVIWSLSNKQRN